MTERDFETFLALLAQMLRTGRRCRRAIVGELRDHLLERLDELTAQGLSREEAMARALEEFGDAAALAAQFTAITSRRRRRLIMRTTIGTFVAAVAVVIGVFALWPQHDRAPLAPRSSLAQQAQPPKPAAAPGDAQQPAPSDAADFVPTEEELNEHTAQALQERIKADFLEIPLADVIRYVADATGTEYYVDRRALEDEGIDPADAPITLELKSVPGDMLLDLALRQAGDLAYTIRSGIIIVTTEIQAEEDLIVRVYDVSDLLASDKASDKQQQAVHALSHAIGSRLGGGGFLGGMGGMGTDPLGGPPLRMPALESLVQLLARRDALAKEGKAEEAAAAEQEFYQLLASIAPFSVSRHQQLIDLIETAVEPFSWEDMQGGPGTITGFRDKLVIAQTAAVHRKVADLLRQLRQTTDLPAAATPQPAGRK